MNALPQFLHIFTGFLLSVPFSDHPNYRTVPENPSPLAVCVGVKDADGNIVWADSPSNSEYRLTNTACTDCCTSAEFECKVGGVTVGINFELSDGGAVYTASVADGREVFVEFPVFVGDGKYESEVTFGCNSVSAAYLGHRCTWSSGGSTVDTGEAFANRNGHYRRFIVSGCGSVRLCCALE